jgi:hypothetical protein
MILSLFGNLLEGSKVKIPTIGKVLKREMSTGGKVLTKRDVDCREKNNRK